MASVSTEIRVMGPLELAIGGRVGFLSGREERVVLSVLVISLGHPVSVDTLVSSIWGDDPPPSASGVLQSVISRLRHQLVNAEIENLDGTYRLHVDPNRVDAYCFEDAVRRAEQLLQSDEPESAQAACLQALGLWRGEPYRDLIDDPDGALEIHRLTELRARVMELYWESEVLLGNHERVVPSLEAAVGSDPYREHVWFLLIVALARSGRRVEALRAYDRLCEALRDIGMEPTADLSELPGKILRDEPCMRPRFAVE